MNVHSGTPSTCKNCEEEGHNRQTCPYECKCRVTYDGEAHLPRDCPNKGKRPRADDHDTRREPGERVCSACGLPGHLKSSKKFHPIILPPAPMTGEDGLPIDAAAAAAAAAAIAEAIRAAQYTCSLCGEKGHSKRNVKFHPVQPAVDADAAEAVDGSGTAEGDSGLGSTVALSAAGASIAVAAAAPPKKKKTMKHKEEMICSLCHRVGHTKRNVAFHPKAPSEAAAARAPVLFVAGAESGSIRASSDATLGSSALVPAAEVGFAGDTTAEPAASSSCVAESSTEAGVAPAPFILPLPVDSGAADTWGAADTAEL